MSAKILLYSLAIACGSGLASVSAQTPRLDFPTPSPNSTLKQHVGLTDIEIVYGRPGAKGRPIFGGLVPFGEVWRTGANLATKITFSTDVKLNGADIPAGSYALFTIPDKKEWTIIINKAANQFGAFQYSETNDLVRVKATPTKLSDPVETFSIDIGDIRDDSATLFLTWEKTRVPVKIQMDVVSKLQPQIEAAMSASGGRKPYYQAAMFYYDHGLDLQKAKTWIDGALAEREAYYMVHLKAKILAKLGDKQGAIAAANRSMELAIQGKDNGYVKLNKDLISSLK